MKSKSDDNTIAAGPRPSIGRLVHYIPALRTKPFAAIITGVFEASDGADMVTLTVFPPGETPRPLPEAVRQGIGAGTWCWPPMVPLAQISR